MHGYDVLELYLVNFQGWRRKSLVREEPTFELDPQDAGVRRRWLDNGCHEAVLREWLWRDARTRNGAMGSPSAVRLPWVVQTFHGYHGTWMTAEGVLAACALAGFLPWDRRVVRDRANGLPVMLLPPAFAPYGNLISLLCDDESAGWVWGPSLLVSGGLLP